MKHIYVNFKRFDVPKELGGVNCLASVENWASEIISKTQEEIANYKNVEFAMFFPEAHILNAKAACTNKDLIIGCQGMMYSDVQKGGNFGAFTSNRPAAAAFALGARYAIIGHCEERADKRTLMLEAGASLYKANEAINKTLNKEIKAAQARGIKVLYCIGENENEMQDYEEVLGNQLHQGLDGVDLDNIVIAYEPIWSIGPGKTPADKPYITKIAKFVKSLYNVDIVYGGGLKQDNAQMLASIEEIDGGLIALTRFSGEIGFYPQEYLEIVKLYLGEN